MVIILVLLVLAIILLGDSDITGFVTRQTINSEACRNNIIKINSCDHEGAERVVNEVILHCFSCGTSAPSMYQTSGLYLAFPRHINVVPTCETARELAKFVDDIKRVYNEGCASPKIRGSQRS